MSKPPPQPARRTRNAEATKSAILTAARATFTRHGYEGTGVREVAAAAGVDAALVIRYFGSKEGLFRASVVHPFDLAGILAGDRSTAGGRLAGYMLNKPPAAVEADPLQMLLRSAPDGPAKGLFRELMTERFVRPLADWLGGPDAVVRARLIAAYLLGLALTRDLIGLRATSADLPLTEATAGRAIQALIDPPDTPAKRPRPNKR